MLLCCVAFQSVTFKKTTTESLFNYMKLVPINFTLPIILQYNSFSTLLRLIFTSESVSQEKIDYVTQLLNLIPSKDNCPATILSHYLKNSNKSEVKMDVDIDPQNIIKSELITSKKYDSILNCPDKLGEKLGKMLLENEAKAEKTGLLVDWLSAVELEIASSDKQKLQVRT